MELEKAIEVQCPYCAEMFTTFLDLSQGSTVYTEDCQVCCQPIQFEVAVNDLENEDFSVSLTAEN